MAAARPAVAIVGGGACGIMACAALVHHAAADGPRLDVHLFEKEASLGDGVAYASPYDWHLLNMQAATMSAAADDPGDFTTWLREHPAPPDRAVGNGLTGAYLPRHRFAAYLRHRFALTSHAAERAGITIEVHHTEVLDCRPAHRRLLLECAPAVRLPAFDAVVLCPGDLPGPAFRELTGHPRYHPDPWHLDHTIPCTAAVGILGTSLTAIDVLAHLDATGHQGPIHCFSRNRPFPTVQPATLTPYRLRHLTPEHLAELTAGGTSLSLHHLTDLLLRELHDATHGTLGPARLLHRATTHEDLATDIEQAHAHRTQWYEALDATAPLAPHLWRAMPLRDRTGFLARHQALWATWRHPMPLPNAHRLHRLHLSGQLYWHPGTRTATADHHGGFTVHTYHDDLHHAWPVDHLVNATGTGFHPWLAAHPLLAALLDRRALAAHPLGGIDVDFLTLQVRPPEGQTHNDGTNLYCVGPLTRGVHFYTNSITTNLTNTSRMATHLTDTLR